MFAPRPRHACNACHLCLLLPCSYYRWHLEASQVSLTQAEQVALGIIQHRESLTQPVARPVQVCVTDLRIASRLVQIEGECEHFEFVVGGFVYREPKESDQELQVGWWDL